MGHTQAALIKALLDPRRYDPPVDAVDLIETHISFILLAGAYAYKIKKAVALGFLDFSTLEKRRFYCEEELRLNRRFAPDLYLDLVAIGGTPARPVLYASGSILEYAIKMARFPQEALLDRMLEAGGLTPQLIDGVAAEVAAVHGAVAGASVPAGRGTPEAVRQPVHENFVQIAERAIGRAENELLPSLRAWCEEEFTRRQKDFIARLENGFVRECHGDLHLGNMALIEGRVTLFDCIEFNPGLRWIDVMSDAAFLVMDLEDRGRPDLAWRFLNAYLERSGDFAGLRVLPYYLVYRAMVRAKVACIRASQPGLSGREAQQAWQRAQSYLAIAARLARQARPWLLITFGYSGSGKTTATQALLEKTGAIRLRSDVERKRLHGLAPEARSQSGFDQGLYAPDAHVQTYRRLAELAEDVLLAGYPVIVDAAFLKRGERDAFHALARKTGVAFVILELRAEADELRRRVALREELGRDASEATLPVLEMQFQRGEGIAPEESAVAVTLDSGAAMEAAIGHLARRLLDNPDGICQD